MGIFYPMLDRGQVEDILKSSGFVLKRQFGTSHAQWEGYIDGKRRIVTVDALSGKMKAKFGRDLLRSMIKQSGMTKQEFYSHLK